LRNVGFPKVLDIWEFCSDELKESLNQGREFEAKLRAEEDAKALEGKSGEEEKKEEKKEESKEVEKGGDVEMKDT